MATSERWTELVETQFPCDITADSTQESLIYPDYSNGATWYPGYYERWFTNQLGFIEHENFVGYDEHLGAICVSVLFPFTTADSAIVKSVVRTTLGFHAIITDFQPDKAKHSRALSVSLSRHMNPLSKYQAVLEEILSSYIKKLKQIYVSEDAMSKSRDSGIDRSHVDLDGEQERQARKFQRWSPSKSDDFFNAIDVATLVKNFEIAPFQQTAKKLLDLEKNFKPCVYNVDVVRTCFSESKEAKANWNAFLAILGKPSKPKVSHLDESTWDPSKAEYSAERKKHALDELAATESRYLDKLRIIQDVYIVPLQSMNIMSKPEFNMAFPKVTDILKLHTEMYENIDSSVKHGKGVGLALLPFLDRLNVYTNYVKSHASAVEKLKELMNSRQNFKLRLEQCDRNAQSERLGLMDLLIEPVQRIPRYSLLLKEIFKYTPPTDDDYDPLKQAYLGFVKVSAKLNQSMKDEESMIKAMDLVKHVENCPADIVKGHRRFIAQYEASEFELSNPSKETASMIYLFNDSIMFARVKKNHLAKLGHNSNKQEIRFVGLFEYASVEIHSLVSRGLENSFQIETPSATTSERSKVIRLGDRMEEVGRLHSRSLSSHSANTTTTGKSSEFDLCKSTHCFRVSGFAEFMRDYRCAASNSQTDDLKTIYHREMDSSSCLAYNVFSSVEDFMSAETKSTSIVFYNDASSKWDVLAGLLDSYKAVASAHASGSFNLSVNIHTIQLPVKVPSEPSSGALPATEKEKAFNSKILYMCKILEMFDTRKRQDHVELLKSNLQQIVAPFQKEKSGLSLSPLKKFNSATLRSRSRRSSVMSFDGPDAYLASVSASDILSTPTKKGGMSSPTQSLKTVHSDSGITRRNSIASLSSTLFKSLSPSKSLSRVTMGKQTENAILDIVCTYLEETALDVDGLYAISMTNKRVEELVRAISTRKLSKDKLQQFETHIIANALKIWISANSSLLWTEYAHSEFVSRFEKEDPATILIPLLDSSQLAFLKRFLTHLRRVVDNENVNFMNLQRMADSFKNVLFAGVPNNMELSARLLSCATLSKSQQEDSDEEEQMFVIPPMPLRQQSPRRSLDGLQMAMEKFSSSPPVSSPLGSSLDMIDEKQSQQPRGDKTPTPDRPQFEVQKTASLKRQQSTIKVARKPVPSPEKDDHLTLRKPSSESYLNADKRRSISLPPTSTLQEKLASINAAKDQEKQQMDTEMSNLKIQIKCLKKALETEIRTKDHHQKEVKTPPTASASTTTSTTTTDWDTVETCLSNIQNLYSIHLDTASETYGALQAQVEQLSNLYRDAQAEIAELKKKLE